MEMCLLYVTDVNGQDVLTIRFDSGVPCKRAKILLHAIQLATPGISLKAQLFTSSVGFPEDYKFVKHFKSKSLL